MTGTTFRRQHAPLPALVLVTGLTPTLGLVGVANDSSTNPSGSSLSLSATPATLNIRGSTTRVTATYSSGALSSQSGTP